MNRSELEAILESKGLDKSVIPFFGGGVQVEINEGIASFRSINASALKHVQKQINEGGMISGQVLTYRLNEAFNMNQLSKDSKEELDAYKALSLTSIINVGKDSVSFILKHGGSIEFEYEIKRVGDDEYEVNDDGKRLKKQSLDQVKKCFKDSSLMSELILKM